MVSLNGSQQQKLTTCGSVFPTSILHHTLIHVNLNFLSNFEILGVTFFFFIIQNNIILHIIILGFNIGVFGIQESLYSCFICFISWLVSIFIHGYFVMGFLYSGY